MSDHSREKQVLSTSQATFLFLMFISMLIIIFAAGVCVGKWTQSGSGKDGAAATVKTTNIRFLQDNSAIDDPAQKLNGQSSAQANASSTSPSQRSEEAKIAAGYTVQVATMSTFEEAESLVTQVRRDGFTTIQIRAPQNGSVNQLYSVELGPYDDKRAADQLVNQLKAKGLSHTRAIAVYAAHQQKSDDTSTAAMPAGQ